MNHTALRAAEAALPEVSLGQVRFCECPLLIRNQPHATAAYHGAVRCTAAAVKGETVRRLIDCLMAAAATGTGVPVLRDDSFDVRVVVDYQRPAGSRPSRPW